MQLTKTFMNARIGALGLVTWMALGCSSEPGESTGTGGAAGTLSSTGGAPGGGGSGAQGSGGTSATGGAPSGGGGTAATGGTPAGGGSGGFANTGGTPGSSGSGGFPGGSGGFPGGSGGFPGGSGGFAGGSGGFPGGSGGAAGGSSGAGGSDACMTGQVAPSEVLFIGDSFIALNNSIVTELQANARAAGVLAQNESYRTNAVSGTTLANNQIPGQYQSGVNSSPVKVVLMNGGGNDCLQMNNPDGAYDAAVPLFQNMAQNGTEDVVYFFYPDPLGALASGTLKTCLDTLRPRMQELCDNLTAPRCHFIDLRPGWTDSDVLTDGIHPTPQGGKKVADQIWAVMQQECIAQ